LSLLLPSPLMENQSFRVGVFIVIIPLFVLNALPQFGMHPKLGTHPAKIAYLYSPKYCHMHYLLLLLLIIILLLLIYFFILKPLLMSQHALSRYHFSVEWGGTRIGFIEVSGLDIEIEAVSFREGSSPEDSFKKLPGLRKYSNITLKRQIAKGDNEFFNWINTKQIGSIERRDVVISLLNDAHEPVVVWKVNNAFPVHYYGPVLLANDGGIAAETLVLTHEGIVIENS
jgi:phage tail-like protein